MRKRLVAICVFILTICFALCFAGCSKGGGNTEVGVTDVTLNKSETTLEAGGHETLFATITPSNATNQSTYWWSSNETVATVDSGSVYAVAEGEATITVMTGNGLTATCTVTVEAGEENPPTQYTVTYYIDAGKYSYGTTQYSVQVDEGSKLPRGTADRGDDYVFTGWYKDLNRNRLWDFENDTVTENTELFAGWIYKNKYQSVMDALEARIKAERDDESTEVEILLIFTDNNGSLCFVEKDESGVFAYSTDIRDFDEIVDNADLISAIPDTTLTQLNEYKDTYTSENNSYIADSMAWKYTQADNSNDAIIYSCVSEWEIYSVDEGKFASNGPWYGCKVNAIVADKDGKVYDCSFTVVAGVADFNFVIGGSALSEEVGLVKSELGEVASDFFIEHIKELYA